MADKSSSSGAIRLPASGRGHAAGSGRAVRHRSILEILRADAEHDDVPIPTADAVGNLIVIERLFAAAAGAA